MTKLVKLFLVFIHVLTAPLICDAFQWPATGQTISYTDTFGEDSDYNNTPQSYTKLGIDGLELLDDATFKDGWVMTRDNVTGLIWEVKTDKDSIHDKDNNFNWSDAMEFINSLNNENFGGFSDWRMPTIKELSTIVNYDAYDPAINTLYFPNTLSTRYWSATTFADYNDQGAWCIDFRFGRDDQKDKFYLTIYVRAVRSGKSEPYEDLVDNGNGTVTDIATGLMWQQTARTNLSWESAIAYCEALSLAGHRDWRLPDINELKSIVDYSNHDPAIDTSFFPDTLSYPYYWSSTSYADSSSHAWQLKFVRGSITANDKARRLYSVRAVRNVSGIDPPP